MSRSPISFFTKEDLPVPLAPVNKQLYPFGTSFDNKYIFETISTHGTSIKFKSKELSFGILRSKEFQLSQFLLSVL